jgi:hypothetical protein
MASLENITSPEIDEKPDNKQENTQPPFNSIEQKLK